MKGNPQSVAPVSQPWAVSEVLGGYYELAKPSIVWLVLMSAVMGGYLAVDGAFEVARAWHALLATALLAAGTGALNQWWERDIDASMRRTVSRPIPSGRVQPRSGLLFGSGLTVAGLVYLFFGVSALCFALGAATVVLYNFVYTPLKTRTWWSTTVGALPGAVPPLLGWAALRDSAGIEAWVLFSILFLWQFPHFYAIAWMYREDYERAGILMLPVVDPTGRSTVRQILLTAALLIPVSTAPAWLGMVASWYVVPSVLLGLSYFAFGLRLASGQQRTHAKDLLKASVLYLPLLYLFLLIAKP